MESKLNDTYATNSQSSSRRPNTHVHRTQSGIDVDEILRPHRPGRYNSAIEAAGALIGHSQGSRNFSDDTRASYHQIPEKPKMGSLTRLSSRDGPPNPFFAGQGVSSRRESSRTLQHPRTLPFEIPPIETDTLYGISSNVKEHQATDTAHSGSPDPDKEVFWPLPDQYERRPAPENLPLKREYRDEIEAARKIVTDSKSIDKGFTRGWKSPQEDPGAAERTLSEGDLEEDYDSGGRAPFPNRDFPSTQKGPTDEARSIRITRVRSPEEGGSATPPPITRARRYIIDDSEADTSPDSFFPGAVTALRAYGSSHVDEAASSAGSTERPPTAIRVRGHSSPRTDSPYGPGQSTRPGSSSSPRSPLMEEESLKEIRTPALNRIERYESAERSQSKGKTPNFSLQRSANYKVDTGQSRMYHDIYARKNDSGVVIDRSRSSKEKQTGSAQGSSEPSHYSSRISEGSNQPVDFFSQGIFQVVLHNPATSHQLLKYCESQVCSENVEFLTKVQQYRTMVNTLAGALASIHKTFISNESSSQVNVPGDILEEVHGDMKALVVDTMPSMESLFNNMQDRIEQLIFDDIYPRFVRYQMAMETAKSLTNDRHQYQGLGDCFCFSNPRQADTPIAYASDGFVQVTGYSRTEIIPRNCRFLQGPQTDRTAIRRVKEAIKEERETVELLLNYKKTGAPFWNLLYIAPLRDETGKVVFFMGGQINCSTTIHSNTDVMRVLSASHVEPTEEPKRQERDKTTAQQKPGRKSFLSVFNRGDKQNPPPPVPNAQTGLEQQVLDRMGGRDMKTQIKEFYSAYSKYLVVRADTFVIKFYSSGVAETLVSVGLGGGVGGGQSIAGQDVFRFFKSHQLGTNQPDVKTPVKKAIKSGFPISIGVRMQTRRSVVFRGDENFMTHWTPLKNEHGTVHWVVITLASMMGPDIDM
ncbi:hypothetical protein SCARD494_03418 [Seiridium cardinale]